MGPIKINAQEAVFAGTKNTKSDKKKSLQNNNKKPVAKSIAAGLGALAVLGVAAIAIKNRKNILSLINKGKNNLQNTPMQDTVQTISDKGKTSVSSAVSTIAEQTENTVQAAVPQIEQTPQITMDIIFKKDPIKNIIPMPVKVANEVKGEAKPLPLMLPEHKIDVVKNAAPEILETEEIASAAAKINTKITGKPVQTPRVIYMPPAESEVVQSAAESLEQAVIKESTVASKAESTTVGDIVKDKAKEAVESKVESAKGKLQQGIAAPKAPASSPKPISLISEEEVQDPIIKKIISNGKAIEQQSCTITEKAAEIGEALDELHKKMFENIEKLKAKIQSIK